MKKFILFAILALISFESYSLAEESNTGQGEITVAKDIYPTTSSKNVDEPCITVTETRLGNGDSEIEVINTVSNIKKTYKINMSTHHHPATSPNDKLVKTLKSWEFGAFICFNSNQFSGTEYCSSKDPVRDFNPTKLDVRQWVKTLKAVGMKYAVLTVRHTSNFLLWDSATSEINVTNSAVKMDLVREYVDQCRKEGIAPGIYYCLWGNGWKPNPNARAIILAQLHELATNYGKIPFFWLDMPHEVGWLTNDLSHQEIYDSLKNVNHDTIILLSNGIGDAAKVRSFPTDVINGEMCSPPPQGHKTYRTIDSKKYYIPFEYEPCSQKRGTHHIFTWDFPGASWFTYGSGKGFEPSKPLPAEFLYEKITEARKRGASTTLMSFSPDHNGIYREEDIAQAVKLGKMLRTAFQKEFLKLRFGLFLHFNMASYIDREWASGYEDPAIFKPDRLDCNQWAEVASAAGMNYGVLTVKHTGGWCLWDSDHTTHDIAGFVNYKNGKGDIVREFVDAFRARGLKVGFYYCFPGDFSNTQHGNAVPKGKPDLHGLPPEAVGDYVGFIKKQLTELLTKYGPIDLLWIDQYSNKYTWSRWHEVRAHIKSLQPRCLVTGNNAHNLNDSDVYSCEFPWDPRGLPQEGNTIPAEVCDKISGTWFWNTADAPEHVKTTQQILEMLKLCNERNANYLLNVPPDRNGLISGIHLKRMEELAAFVSAQGNSESGQKAKNNALPVARGLK